MLVAPPLRLPGILLLWYTLSPVCDSLCIDVDYSLSISVYSFGGPLSALLDHLLHLVDEAVK